MHRQRGTAVCANATPLPMVATDAAILDALETSVLDPRVVERAMLLAIAALAAPPEPTPSAADLRAQLTALDGQLARLTEAIKAGAGAVPVLAQELAAVQQRRDAVAALLVPAPARPRLGQTALRRDLEARLAEWQATLRRNIPQGRQLLRKLLVGRVRFTPGAEGVAFEGECALGPILQGVASAELIVSRPGFAHTSIALRGLLPRAA